MACRKYTLTNNSPFTQTYTYQECNNLMWNYDFTIEAGQTRTIWLINGTYAAPLTSSLSVSDDGAFPPPNTPTPSPTPTSSVTPTPSITPTITTSISPSPTPSITPTTTITSSVTPTPTITPTNTPTPSSTPPIQGLFFTIQEVGPDVVLSGTGTANLSSLNLEGTFFSSFGSVIRPSSGRFSVGSGGNYSTYSGSTFNPVPFGSGFLPINADISTGNNFGIGGFGNLVVPQGYVGGALNGTGTFTATTLATLGVTVPGGPYLIQWGASGASETITLVVS
jgi:hypothetical protein